MPLQPLTLVAACAALAHAKIEPDFKGFGYTITTKSSAAQLAFDEGFMHTSGFNQEEAQPCFERCAAADPDSPMCYWGLAYALGPYLNRPTKSPGEIEIAFQAAANATAAAARAGSMLDSERALVRAMALRYPADSTANQTQGYIAYSKSLEASLAAMPPADPHLEDVRVFFAER
jgi:hypothetical protein